MGDLDKAALDAINVYNAACYYGFPIDDITDEVEQKAYQGIIRTYGQVPKVTCSLHCRSLEGTCLLSIVAIISPTSSSRTSEQFRYLRGGQAFE